jgi:hypothetical protein
VRTTSFTIGTASRLLLSTLAGAAMVSAPAFAQVRSVDPDQAIDGDLSRPQASTRSAGAPAAPAAGYRDRADVSQDPDAAPGSNDTGPADGDPDPGSHSAASSAASAAVDGKGETYHEDDLIGAAQGVFGKGAKGLAQMIRDILKKQGEPDGYIVGREGGGAFVVGLRYGSGTLYHKVEGERPVYWTGPSVGFDAGGEAGNAFVLVYNLYDSQDLYKRFVAGEGQAYLIGGFNVSYLRAGSVVLVPVRMGVGVRLGANIGYMKFSQKQNWVPF